MGQDDVELVRRMFDAWNRDDREGWLATAHPEIEWSSAVLREVEGPNSSHRGRSGLRRFWDEWHAVWNMAITLSETRDLGDTVLALADIRTKATSSGVVVERAIGYVIQLEDGLICRASAYLTQEEALEAAGLHE